MKKKTNFLKSFFYCFTSIFMLISCAPLNVTTPSEQEDAEPIHSTLPALPAVYSSPYLNPLDTPHTYVDDTCRYLRNKWNPANAEPDTVVMIVMFGKIQAGPVTNPNGINVWDFMKTMQELKFQGFEAITMKEFLFFIERNAKIPPRSVLIIQDGNYEEEYFNKNFREYWENWGWPVVNGWQSNSEIPETLWRENINMENEGWVDHQAHGVMPDTKLSDESSKTVIARELQGSLDAFAGQYGKTPIAFIWPNGGFGLRPVEAARLLGYQLGFTANSRGPVMYNWIPLANEIDPERPGYIPEGQINDPLMTLPRYLPDQAYNAIDQVRAIGNEASAYAQANKELEYEYYEIVCSETYGRMPTP